MNVFKGPGFVSTVFFLVMTQGIPPQNYYSLPFYTLCPTHPWTPPSALWRGNRVGVRLKGERDFLAKGLTLHFSDRREGKVISYVFIFYIKSLLNIHMTDTTL